MQTIITTDQNSTLSTQDRGLNYGDGFFTTAKVVDGKVQYWPYHKARLTECAQRLGFPNINFTELEERIGNCIQSYKLNVLKIVVTRGEGGRGYSLPTECNLTILLNVAAYPQNYLSLHQDGVSLAISPIKLAAQPLLAGLKTLNRLEQVLIKKAMQNESCDDVIVLDYNNNVIEASAANIFAIKGGRVFTPKLEECGIKGVYLQSLCDKLAIEFKVVSVEDLIQADAVFVCNSLMAAIPVKSIGSCIFDVSKSQLLLKELLAKEAKC
ncbi:4-amino-4-deoxychorismate lyase [Pseudoalteromonas carrageenovora]|uniref:Aminodeoxychorismate lyase n=1 Tax=Pseudoalteromonas carrageenovora IAM 12662 TaxID=1314868 RepID=A0A2K4XA56_PSEVC|nr:aminodeoxychorismate lyase [Pseudoalteromonas carrageenovora]MBE0381329.1 4-amino-4-deoxychorismate lyase [Pseudoalteromonas carrageenovora IAM 12662]QBJ72086.1 4-amino-4-deoxychorismate lyase [Pseudoalteromonas carrageenovora]GEB71077.1 aminodeoxychorismate lyase [Pseudoalteromonas carrageenovora]SOU41194.1 Aminodeoxychorismate lyase [Pseudoalteromonas carrageenovora IAM 12662]